jgi:hypothetical protein
MSQLDNGPFNITGGNSAEVVAEFFDSNGNLSIPAGATLVVSYTNINNAPQTDTTTMSLVNSFYTAVWSSTSASYGLANASIIAAGNSSASQIWQFRVIDP